MASYFAPSSFGTRVNERDTCGGLVPKEALSRCQGQDRTCQFKTGHGVDEEERVQHEERRPTHRNDGRTPRGTGARSYCHCI